MKILLIEPDKVLAKTYLTYLKQHGFEVFYASDAQYAVHVIDDKQPDAILLEMQLARHNGIEFLYELRSYADWQHIPVIAHTLLGPSSMSMSSELLRALGVVTYLYKPATSLSKLKRTITEVLQPAAA